ncbi:arylesterase [Segnochrobactrum spirostomi]|uniref:Arylesterase n=1 Tax=Segnochrobactrum spirostomi TaxID=2608987 RepID=A0A6A7Y167_9HYPH|nr:arylesterase [Segnochrobactrum spirostomi]MQT12714.1 arylesterase [Segnochrobactrum spirostomi]
MPFSVSTGLIAAAGLLAASLATPGAASAEPVRIVALGDSLTAGYGLPEAQAFPTKLQAALKAKGYDVEIVNAGVSGDTAADGLARLDWSVPDGTDGVILELGANDMLRAQDPGRTKADLDAILTRLGARRIPVLVAGMLAARNLGPDYGARFDALFPALAKAHGALLYPFFLDGVATDPALNQADGLHPNARGVDVIVARILPSVEALIAEARTRHP